MDERAHLRPARLSLADLARIAASGLRVRPVRVVLSALGIAIGIAAMVAVVGLSTSSRAELSRQLDALGTNMLTVEPGRDVFGDTAQLPSTAASMVKRIGPVRAVSTTGATSANAYRNDHIPPGHTGSITVLAAQPGLLDTVGARMALGHPLDAGSEGLPVVVLGSTTAEVLGVTRAGTRIWVGGQWFGVRGILQPDALAPELDRSVLVDWTTAERLLGFDGQVNRIFTRSDPSQVEAVRSVLAATANPEAPFQVRVSRPSEALAAQRASAKALNGLLLGLALVALVVGAIGVGNTMVIAVLERRSEIGLRRALGATRRQVMLQFISESLLVSALGGLVGAVLGIAVTGAYATSQGWPVAVPVWAVLAGVALTLPVGALAGFLPALRAARLAPVAALSDA